MRFLLECTYVFDHPDENAGIQRVVRNIINNLPNLTREEACIPIAFKRGKAFRVTDLKIAGSSGWIARLRNWAQKRRVQYWLRHETLKRKKPFVHSRNLRRLLFIVFRLFSLIYIIPLAVVVAVTRFWIDYTRLEHLEVKPHDVIVLLDSSWHFNFFKNIEALKSKGVKVVGLVHDLIPLSHPQFFDDKLVRDFGAWFDKVAKLADGFICVSNSTSDQVRRFDRLRSKASVYQKRWYDHFYNGAALDLVDMDAPISPEVREVFASKRPVYLMVGTIEPRKNHAYVIDAFDRLWADGRDISLCIVGKMGWKYESIIKRIETHPQRERRLFLLSGLSDNDLAHCYQASKALIFSSFIEGFGLPLIESFSYGLPVLASDIPVFREIAGDLAFYFDLTDPASLCQTVKTFESLDFEKEKEKLKSWKWLSWKESADLLLDRVKENLDKPRNASRIAP